MANFCYKIMNSLNRIFNITNKNVSNDTDQAHSTLDNICINKNEPNTNVNSNNVSATSYYSIQETTPINDKLLNFSIKLQSYLSEIFTNLDFTNAIYKLFTQINYHLYKEDLNNIQLIQLIHKEQSYFKQHITENTHIYNNYIQKINKLNDNLTPFTNSQKEIDEYNLMHRWLNEGMKITGNNYKNHEKETIVLKTLNEISDTKTNIDKLKLTKFNIRQIKMKILNFEMKKEKLLNKINLTKMLIIE
jgi:hypothetical protein